MRIFLFFTLIIFLVSNSNALKNRLRHINVNLGQNNAARVDRKLFNQFIDKFGKTYENELEIEMRFSVFQQNMKMIEILNKEEQGTAFYGLTEFADLTAEEFSSKAAGLRPELKKASDDKMRSKPKFNRNMQLPESWDWRDHGAVTEIKNQGMCGSCWAFSTTGNVEGVNFVKNKKLISLSEEQLVDCDTLDHGCNGGYMTNAYKAIKDEGGLETEDDYPYKGLFGKNCSISSSKPRVNIDSYVELSSNETEIAQYLVEHGPISIGINAAAMQFYIRGVSHPWKWLCSPKKIDHGVLIVGYGVTTKRSKEIPYWIVKNSWGHQWGQQGYYYVHRGDGTCGVNAMASSAVIN